jgi:hypothetical protein
VIRFKPRPTACASPPSRFPMGKRDAAISVTVARHYSHRRPPKQQRNGRTSDGTAGCASVEAEGSSANPPVSSEIVRSMLGPWAETQLAHSESWTSSPFAEA